MLPVSRFYQLRDFQNLIVIGNGGGGRIYKGEHPDFGQIAVKEFFWSSNQPAEEYKREVEILLKIRHPNIVQLFGALWNGSDSTVYLGYVMEYIKGGSLHDVIHNPANNYDMTQIYQWIKQIAIGLQYLHKDSIIHRDIKPENILMAEGQLKLADFGIARDVDISVTPFVGTFRYMAPEVITTGKYGPPADVYSLAITIWEIFHRKRPFSGQTGKEMVTSLQEIMTGARPIITESRINTEMAKFIQSCWQANPSNRPAPKDIIEYFEANVAPAPPVRLSSVAHFAGFRGSHSVNNTILVTTNGFQSDMVLLNSDRRSWTELKITRGLVITTGIFLNGTIYLYCGGQTNSNLYKLNMNTGDAEPLADMIRSSGSIGDSCLACNQFIWMLGGYIRSAKFGLQSLSNAVERYDPKEDKWTEMPPMKYSRAHAATVNWKDKIIICGGQCGRNALNNSVECFDPVSQVWTEFVNLPLARCKHSLVSYGDRLILLGGCCHDEAISTVMELDCEKWKELPQLRCPSMEFSTNVLDGKIYVIGGCERIGAKLNRVQIFDGENWRDGPALPYQTSNSSSMIIPQHIASCLVEHFKKQ